MYVYYTWLWKPLQLDNEKQRVNRSFNFNWKMTLFSGFFFVLFVNLGFWQLQRATEKEDLIAAEAIRKSQPSVLLSELPKDLSNLSGIPVRLKGEYVPDRLFLLDNRVLKGRVGFEVLVPYRESDGRMALINRGFVPMGRTREVLPIIPGLNNQATADGLVYIGAENIFALAAESSAVARWPRIVQTSDPLVLQRFLGETLYPHLIRLDQSDTNALPRNWPTTTILPVKHQGYALQWFTMAFAIAVAFTFFSFRREDD